MILSSFFKALRQIGDRRFRQVLFLGIGLSVLFLAGATLVVFTLINWSFGPEASLPLIGSVSWASDVMSWTALGFWGGCGSSRAPLGIHDITWICIFLHLPL